MCHLKIAFKKEQKKIFVDPHMNSFDLEVLIFLIKSVCLSSFNDDVWRVILHPLWVSGL